VHVRAICRITKSQKDQEGVMKVAQDRENIFTQLFIREMTSEDTIERGKGIKGTRQLGVVFLGR
jgi:hypothetical protein